MAVDMALAQLVASIAASTIAYTLSKSGKQIWRPILGFILGWIVGWVAGFFLGMVFFKGDTVGVQMRAMGTTFWMALIFSGVGVFLGRRKLKSGGASHNVIVESMPEFVALTSPTKLPTPNPPSVQMNSSTETSHTMPTPSKPFPLPGSAAPPDIADEDYFYGIVANELDTGNTDKGLWTRLYAQHDGDEKKTKIAYIKQRAEKLIVAGKSRLLEIAAAEEAARQQKLQQEQAAEQFAVQNHVSVKQAFDMITYGISKDGEKFLFGPYRYDRLEDALAYAKRTSRK